MIVGSGIIDLELGRFIDTVNNEWITDSTVDDGQAWGYMHNASYKSAPELIHYLVDNVSKNGYLLLNVGPRADGTIPEEARETLAGIGRWLRVNGEAIYGTSPWHVAQEGPTVMKTEGMFSESEKMIYTPEDIRYTCKKQDVYATILARPCSEAVLKNVVKHLMPGEIERIRLLGHDQDLAYRLDGDALIVAMPTEFATEPAYVLKVSRRDILGT
jgi:alpha-L-fucosidase